MIREREILPKNYIDIYLTPTFALSREQQNKYFNFKGNLQTGRIGTSGFKSERKMSAKPFYSNLYQDECKYPGDLQGLTPKTSISNRQSKESSIITKQDPSDRISNDRVLLPLPKEKKDLNFDNFNLIKPINPGFRGYKFSTLNTNRNLVKSKCLRRLC